VLAVSTVGCIAFTAALALAGRGDIWLAVTCLVAANYFFGSGENLIAAFLPELAREEDLGKVSGWGWALGYLGGIATLGLCLAYVSAATARGESAEGFVPVTLIITAATFALAALPTFVVLKERALPQSGQATRGAIAESMARLADTVLRARQFRDLLDFSSACCSTKQACRP
jgi:UMF1 family MFS transporter